MERIQIKDIEFGKIDAYNELLEFGPEFYMHSFLLHEKYKADSFLRGDNYLICGNKGTGKTAFLKYLECLFSARPEELIIPIRFKTDFDEDDRKGIRIAGNAITKTNVMEDLIDEKTIDDSSSYLKVWQVYLINQIVSKSECRDGEFNVFQITPEYEKMRLLLKALYSEQKERIIPKLTKGYAEVEASIIKGIDVKLGLEIELNKSSSVISFSKTAKKIIELFAQLKFGTTPVKILVDELELSVRNTKEYKRDVELIRDLVLAIDKLNHLFKDREYQISIIASIRSEVLNNVLSYGYEINKCVEDYGVTVEWYQKGGTREKHPLLKLIENKINASEIAMGVEPTKDVWSTYFAETVNGVNTKDYILSYSWYRPRDIIRMMRMVQNQCGNERIITQEMFDKALQEYSEKTWNEIAEELSLFFTNKDDIKAIKKYLTGIDVPFTFNYLEKRAKELSSIYPYVKDFFERYRLIDVCEKLFEWGIIGNSGQRMAFAFLGDRELNPTSDMILHKPLRNLFAVKSRKKKR